MSNKKSKYEICFVEETYNGIKELTIPIRVSKEMDKIGLSEHCKNPWSVSSSTMAFATKNESFIDCAFYLMKYGYLYPKAKIQIKEV